MKKAIIFYILSLFPFGLYVIYDLILSQDLSTFGRVTLLCLGCLFLHNGGILLSKYKNNNKPMIINLWIFFILYLILLITLTLFDPLWLRQGIHFSLSNINLIPFKTITKFIKVFDSLYSTSSIMYNLIGNFVCLMPMALFLPLLFKKQNNFKTFLKTCLLIVLTIETIQLITSSGSFDIDDIILNVLGATVLYGIFKIKCVNNLIRNIFLLEKNEITKKEYIKIILVIFIIILIFILLIKYRQNLYNKNYNEYLEYYNPTITFKYDDTYTDDNLFYEDEVYKYYFNLDSSKFYVILNDKEKLKISEIDKSDYKININNILYKMDYENIEYKIVNKYSHYEAKINSNNISVPGKIENEYVKIIIKDKDEKYDINFIPLKKGSTKVKVDFDNGNVFNFKITIDENLNLNYELV